MKEENSKRQKTAIAVTFKILKILAHRERNNPRDSP